MTLNKSDYVPSGDTGGGSIDASLVGSWNPGFNDSGDYAETVLTLLESGEFFFFNSNPDGDPCREIGYEYGTYSITGNELSFDREIDTNGCVGIFDAGGGDAEDVWTITSSSENSFGVTILDATQDPGVFEELNLTLTRIAAD